MRWDCVGFQRVQPCTYHKNTSNIFTVSYLILIHLWNQYTYIIYSLPQVWNEITADNQHNLGKTEKSQSSFTWRSMEGDCNAYALRGLKLAGLLTGGLKSTPTVMNLSKNSIFHFPESIMPTCWTGEDEKEHQKKKKKKKKNPSKVGSQNQNRALSSINFDYCMLQKSKILNSFLSLTYLSS